MRLEDELSDISRLANLLEIAPVAIDFVTTVCGKHIGSGSYRSVFEYNIDDRFVVKVEPLNTNCNQTEYRLWEEIKGLHSDLAFVPKWFAPVEWISPNGRILLMRKTSYKPSKERPTKIPEFLTDIKPDNFGWIGNNFVCHDYGQDYGFMHFSKKMKKAEWNY